MGIGKPATQTIETKPEVHEKEETKSGFSMEHPWPFCGSAPTDSEVLELLQGVETSDGHSFYAVDGEHRRRVRNSYLDPRRIVWWLEGRSFPEGSTGLTTTCGVKECISLSHLVLKWPEKLIGPEPLPKKDVTQVNKKPAKIESKKETFQKGDRTRCVSAKVFFDTEKKAKAMAVHINHDVRRSGGRKVYDYDCPWCEGFHLTKTNPSKHKFVAKGSW